MSITNTLLTELARINRRAANPRPVNRIIAEIMAQSSQTTIETGGRPDAFRGLALSTLIARAGGRKRATGKRGNFTARARRVMGGAKPLFSTGRLLRSINSDATDEKAIWGSNLIQARLLNLGGKAGRGKRVTVPAREYIGADQPFAEDIEKIDAAVKAHLGVD